MGEREVMRAQKSYNARPQAFIERAEWGHKNRWNIVWFVKILWQIGLEVSCEFYFEKKKMKCVWMCEWEKIFV